MPAPTVKPISPDRILHRKPPNVDKWVQMFNDQIEGAWWTEEHLRTGVNFDVPTDMDPPDVEEVIRLYNAEGWTVRRGSHRNESYLTFIPKR